ncbi:MAG: response regulator [Candidatus Eremiobacteraeota bacterium]|nr:response regulator [Candidatus Eremiobacteraeota bacterium]
MAENILVVEDDPLMLAALEILLEDEGYNVTTASSGLEAIERAKETEFDLVVSDVRMAEMDGIETISNVKQQQPDTRSIVITGYASPDVPIQAIKMGVDDYIMKPFDDRQFVASVKRCLESFKLQKAYTSGLQAQWRDFASIIKLLSEGVEERDPHFAGHSRRVAETSLKVARKLAFSRDRLEVLELAAYLHDIGSIGQKKALLDKTAELVEEEVGQIQNAVTEKSKTLFSNVSSLREVFRVILHHHEWFDGTGYPAGLKGEDIPIESRVLCVAEAFDAMTSQRPHRPPLGHADARSVLQKESGTHFDPHVVKQFLEAIQDAGDDESEDVKEVTLSRDRQVELMLGIAGTYLSAGDLETAGKGFSEAVDLLGEEGSGRLRASALEGLALSFLHRGRVEDARGHAEKALEASVGESQLIRGRAKLVLGLVRGLQEEFDKGLADLDEAAESFEIWEAHHEKATCSLYRGRVLKKAGKAEESRDAVRAAVQLIDDYELMQVLKQERHLAVPLLLSLAGQPEDTPSCDRLLLWLGWDAVSPFIAEVEPGARERVMELLSVCVKAPARVRLRRCHSMASASSACSPAVTKFTTSFGRPESPSICSPISACTRAEMCPTKRSWTSSGPITLPKRPARVFTRLCPTCAKPSRPARRAKTSAWCWRAKASIALIPIVPGSLT